MLETLVALTALLCAGAVLIAWQTYKDVFHPLVLCSPMFAFMYVLMPVKLLQGDGIYTYVTVEQCIAFQWLVLGCLAAFVVGCTTGSQTKPERSWRPRVYDGNVIRKGGYILGGIGLGAWMFAIRGAGGIANVFSHAKGMGWNEFGFIREAAYLMIVGLLLLFSPQGYKPNDSRWRIAVAAFSAPYMIQGLLGAQRGPTFLVATTLGLSWFFARRTRPSLPLLAGGGCALGFLMLFLVTNRGSIYIGSEEKLSTDVSGVLEANEANEYIFGVGCFTASRQTGEYFWGKRYAAQILVRPVPRQIWPTKYADFGIPEIEQNAGVAKTGFSAIMGWQETPGAAAGMVADVWVELSWLAVPFLGVIGWIYGYLWRRAIVQGAVWITSYTIMALLSVYFITQSGEAVIFRALILTFPAAWVWRKSDLLTLSKSRAQ